MPFLTIPMGADGPIVEIGVTVSLPRQTAMTTQGIPAPPPQLVRALIDTGASCTCIDNGVIIQLGLQPTGTAQMVTPSTGSIPTTVNQYDLAIYLFMDNQHVHQMAMTIPVIGADFSSQTIDALIGRDLLSEGGFFYNGTTNTLTIAF